MTHPFPVYKEIADVLNDNPEVANKMSVEQLSPVIRLSESTNRLLRDDIIDKVISIYKSKTPKLKVRLSQSKPNVIPNRVTNTTEKPKAQGKLKIKAMIKSPACIEDHISKINQNHEYALGLNQDKLEKIIKWSDKNYYEPAESGEVDLLKDSIYDYVKRVYNQRRLGTNDKRKTLLSISSKTGVGVSKPKRERDHQGDH